MNQKELVEAAAQIASGMAGAFVSKQGISVPENVINQIKSQLPQSIL